MANPSLQIGNSNWAIKEDNLLGYSTAGTRFVPQPITMTRESAGTRVNSSGLVETVELLGSEEIVNGDFATDSNWSKNTGWTISGGTANKDSVDTNYLTQDFSGNGQFKITYTISGYVSGDVRLRVGTGFSTIIRTSNGTYTEYITKDSASFGFYGVGEFSIDNVSVKESTKNNLARVDYDGTASSLLVEPERTNDITYSSDFSSWTAAQSSVTLTSNAAISPEGLQNATQIVFSDNTQTQLFQYIAAVSGTVYTTSTFIKYKSGTDRNIKIGVYDSEFKVIQLNFNTDGTIASTSTSGTLVDSGYEDYGNGWYRAYIVHTGATTGNIEVQFNRVGLSNTNEQFYIYGSQLEVGFYPTSYIPTDGSTVTRVQDQYSKTGISNLINSEEGVLFLEIAALSLTSTLEMLSLSDGTYNNVVLFRYYDTSSNDIQVQVKVAGSAQASMLFTLTDATSFNKIAFKYKENDFALWVNGVEVGTDTSGITFTSSTLNKLSFDRGDGSNPLFSKVKQLQVFKTALTDSELATLTTI